MEKILSFEELKEYYNSSNPGCRSWLGKIYVPGHTEYRELPIIKKEIKHKKTLKLNDGSIVNNVNFEVKKLQDPEFYREYVEDKINDLTCKSHSCKYCRNILKNNLHQQIQKEVLIHNLNIHNIITFPGLSLRKKISYADSFKLVNNDWDKLVRLMNYHYDRLKKGKYWPFKNSMFYENKIPDDSLLYICLPRAQANPVDDNPAGFCHLHNIMNWLLNVYWLDEIIKKNNYKFGYTFVRKNQSVADYLCKDFFEDDEWVIPFGTRHYHTSRGINLKSDYLLNPGVRIIRNLDNEFVKDSDSIKTKNNSMVDVIEDQLKYNYTNYEVFGKKLKVEDPRILPFEEYVKKFVALQDQDKEVYNYGSLKRYNVYNKKHNDFYYKKGV